MNINIEVIKSRFTEFSTQVKIWSDEVGERRNALQEIIDKEGLNTETKNLLKSFYQMKIKGTENFIQKLQSDILSNDLTQYGDELASLIKETEDYMNLTLTNAKKDFDALDETQNPLLLMADLTEEEKSTVLLHLSIRNNTILDVILNNQSMIKSSLAELKDRLLQQEPPDLQTKITEIYDELTGSFNDLNQKHIDLQLGNVESYVRDLVNILRDAKS